MKSIIVLSLLFVLATNLRDAESKRYTFEELREGMRPIRDICIKRTEVDPNLVDDASKGKFSPNRKLQCYYKCLMLMMKVMTKDDKLKEAAFVRNVRMLLKEEDIKPVMKSVYHCRSTATKPYEGCKLAYELFKCYYEFNPELTVFP